MASLENASSSFLDNARKKLRVLARIYFAFAVIMLCISPIAIIALIFVAIDSDEFWLPFIGGGCLVLGLSMLISSLMLQAKVECYEDVHNIAQAVANGSLTQASQIPQFVEKALNETELPEI